MRAHTKKLPTEQRQMARFFGPVDKIAEVRKFALSMGLNDIEESIDFKEAFPRYTQNPQSTALRGYRTREGLTQDELSAKTGIPRRHISDMEHGRRPIGKQNAMKLAAALNCDYRRFL